MVTRYCWNAHNEQGDCSFSGHSHNVDFPWETADIYCQFWALFQNGPFSYLSAKRLGSREWRNIQDLSSYFPQKKEYQGVATFTFTFILLFSPEERIPGGGHFQVGLQAGHQRRRQILGLSSSSNQQNWQESWGHLGDQSALWVNESEIHYRKNQPLARKPTREQYFPQMRPKSRCVLAPP